MLRFRVTSEVQPRSKKGAPAQSTTGIASASCAQGFQAPCSKASSPGTISPMVMTTSGTVSAAATAKRRRKSISSGLGGASAVKATGSKAMPQTGQAAGVSLCTPGHIGQK